jgi:hypothetical protein
MIYDRVTTTLVHCFLLRDVAFEELGLQVLSWWCLCCCYKDWDTEFYFLVLLFFWLCTSVLLLGYCVVAEAECNWYLCDINIFLLSKKKLKSAKLICIIQIYVLHSK